MSAESCVGQDCAELSRVAVLVLESGRRERWSFGVREYCACRNWIPDPRGWCCFLGAGWPSLLRASEFEDSDSTELAAVLPGEASESRLPVPAAF